MAFEKQFKAHTLNPNLLKPPTGVNYRKIQAKQTYQALAVVKWVNESNEPNALIARANVILENLTFGLSHDLFEQAFNDLADIIGFQSDRPEKETRTRPQTCIGE